MVNRLIVIALVILLLGSPLWAQGGVPAQDLADPDGQFIVVDGFEIYYIERGAPDAPVVMLLHGFGGATVTWRDNMDSLADAGYRVIAYDRPPFGLSDKRTDFDMSGTSQATLAVALADALCVERAVWVGHSMGGGVIAHIAVMYPERVEGLVFVAGAVWTDSQTPETTPETVAGEQSPFMGSLTQLASTLDPESPVAQGIVRTFLTEERFLNLLADAYHPSHVMTEAVAEGYARVLRVQGWEGAFLAMLSGGRASDSPDSGALSAVRVPALLIWGEEDTWIPLDVGQRLQAHLPESTLLVYPDTGHLPMEEQTERFNTDLLTFLAQVWGN